MIKNILKRIYLYLLKKKNVIKWNKQSRKLRSLSSYKNIQKLEDFGRSIILIPHADDEWVGCSTLLRKDTDLILCNVDMSGGDSDLLHKQRYKELEYVAAVHNKKIVTLRGNKQTAIKSIIVENDIYNIFVPFFFDWHDEHRETMFILKSVLEDLNKEICITMYQVSLPIAESRINYANGYDKKTWRLKWNNFEIYYKTQLSIPYKRFSYTERVNGALISAYAAEVFSACSKDEWLMNFHNWLLDEQEIQIIKLHLQDIVMVKKLINDFAGKRIWKIQK